MTICYFTATGNCLYVARRIGGTLRYIPQLMRQERIEIEDDAVDPESRRQYSEKGHGAFLYRQRRLRALRHLRKGLPGEQH